ncbi:MAG: hypothetical protein AAF657_25080 [Acidobacteriota bacterium]
MTTILRPAGAERPEPADAVATEAVATAPAVGFEVGNRFPEIVLPSLEDGKPLSIASFRGRKVALHIWASW